MKRFDLNYDSNKTANKSGKMGVIGENCTQLNGLRTYT